jgi:hypothetical protein
MPAHDIDEARIALGRPDRGAVTGGPNDEARNPEPKPQRDGGRKRAKGNGDRARRTAQQDRIGQSPMHWRVKASYHAISFHQTSAPPLKEKKERKKLEAAKAIERPKTIWMSLRNPPDVSPKANVKPVMVMMMTDMIFATGPCTDCRIWFNGVSQGMEEPDA